MKRGLVWFLVAWMSVLTVWMVALTFGAVGPNQTSAAYADSPVLDVHDLVVVRYESFSGGVRTEIRPPQTMPLWRYVEGGDGAIETRLDEFERAFEQDLHDGDLTFHRTHEVIDDKEW